MNGDLGHWQESYSSFYSSAANDDHYVESGDVGYGIHYTPAPDVASMVDVVHPSMHIMTGILRTAPFSHTSFTQDDLYFSPGSMSTGQRQQTNQRLHIDTQLSPYQTNELSSSTTSSSSFKPLQTPYFQLHPSLQPAIHTSSSQSASEESGMLMPDLEKLSPLPTSPLSYYSPSSEGDVFDRPTSPLPIESTVVTQVPMPHILEWKRVIEQCGTIDFVPQTIYQPYTEADKKRYIRDVELQETIFFHTDDLSDLGISLDDALKQRLRHLRDKGDRMFVNCGPSVSIRIQWPGYPVWSKQIPTMDFKTPKGHITRVKLAKNIATCIRRFVEEMQDKPMEAESDIRWKVGKRHITVQDLILVSLHHVSKGSWQPQLRLRSPFTAFPFQWEKSFQTIPAV